MTKRVLPVFALVALVSACSSRDQQPGAAQEQARPMAAAGDSVTIKGSDTLVLLAQRMAERFMASHPGTTVQVTGGGTGTGIAALINGTTDIATASRPMKEEEKRQVQQRRGAPAVETAVALDAVAVYVHETNAVPSLTLKQLAGIYTGQIRNWKEVGGADTPILLYGRENNSGTYAYFKEEVLDDGDFAAETLSLPGTAAVIHAVARDAGAIGYGGIAYAKGIRTVPLRKDESSAPVEPSLENVTSAAYPLSRRLFFYTAGAASGTTRSFIEYALSDEGQKIAAEVGYYPLPRGNAQAPTPQAPAAAGTKPEAGAR